MAGGVRTRRAVGRLPVHSLILVPAMIAGVFSLWLVLFGPKLLVPTLSAASLRDVPDPARRHELQNDRIKLQNDVRTTLLQGLGGMVVLLGAYYTARQVRVSREQLQHNIEASQEQHRLDRQQQEIEREGQITERFVQAIDQLGGDKVDVRLGGIYTLERIARDSPADRAAIGEILTAYIRVHAPRPPDQLVEVEDGGRDSYVSLRFSDEARRVAREELADLPKLRLRAVDVQAAITVLGRRNRDDNAEESLVLAGVDLRRVDLRDLNFARADMYGVNLQKAWMDRVNLQGTTLRWADMQWTYPRWANLRGADLRSADFYGAKLDGADLRGARANSSTRWPEEFDWRAAGVVIEDDHPRGSDLPRRTPVLDTSRLPDHPP